jgi:hypothetical protein
VRQIFIKIPFFEIRKMYHGFIRKTLGFYLFEKKFLNFGKLIFPAVGTHRHPSPFAKWLEKRNHRQLVSNTFER